jgi:hypothetical protein
MVVNYIITILLKMIMVFAKEVAVWQTNEEEEV